MKKISLILLLTFAFFIKAQPPSNFLTRFGGTGVDVGYSVKYTLDRQYIVAGSSSSYGSGGSDVYLTKVDSMGLPIWDKTYGGFNSDIGRSVVQLLDSGFVICGFTNSYGNGGYDILLIRTDKLGNFIWQKTFGGSDWDFAYDIVLAPDGNVVVCGTTNGIGNGKRDGVMLKYDQAGNLIWQKSYGGSEDDELNALIVTNDNQLAALGYTKSKGEINGDFYFIKTDLNGDTLFTKTYGGPGIDYGTDLIARPATYLVSGAKTYSNNAYTEATTFELGLTGAKLNEANFYVSGGVDEKWTALTNSYAGPGHTAYLRNIPVSGFKTQGNMFVCINNLYPYLVNSYGSGEDETMYAIDATKDGGYISVGTTNGFNSVNGDVFLIKQDSFVVNYQNLTALKQNELKQEKWILKNLGANHYEIEMMSELYKSVVVTNIYGAEVVTLAVSDKKAVVSLENLPASVYVVTIKSSERKPIVFKLIKN